MNGASRRLAGSHSWMIGGRAPCRTSAWQVTEPASPVHKPLNIVMKLVRANGQPVAKLSDTPGKTLCDDETYLAYLRQVFNVKD